MRWLYDRILAAWIRGDVATLAQEDRLGEAPDPVVEQAVLVERNRDWVKSVGALKGRPLIAVGAGHLAGKDNMIDLLRAGGERVKNGRAHVRTPVPKEQLDCRRTIGKTTKNTH